MNKLPILCVLAAVAAFPQAQTPLTITNSAGSATGELRMQERRTNGTNYVGIKAPQSIAASLTFTMPGSDGQANDCLQTDGSGQWGWATCGSGVDVVTTDYDWSQTPGGSLTAATPATKTLTPCPDGVAPYSTHHNLRISGGTGTAETVLITAVSGSGSTCDITFTPANNHSGAWAIASASDGIQEAARMVTGAKRLFVPLGQQTMDAPAPGEETTVYIQQGITIAGAGNDPGTGSYVYAAGDQWAMIFDTIYPVHVSNLVVGSNGAQASGGGIKLTAGSTLQNCNSTFHDLQLSQLRTAMYLERGCIPFITNSMFSAYSYEGLRLENIDNPDAGDQTITGNYFQVVGAGGIGTTAIKWLSAGGARIISNKFNTQGGAIDLESNTNTIIASIVGNSFDNQTEFSVKVRAPSPDSFAFVNVSSNIFTGAGASGYKAIDIGDATDDIDNVAIIGNNMQGDGTAIRIGSADKVTIDGNTIGLYALGIQTTSAATQVALGQNTLYSLTTKYDISNDANVRPTAPLFVSGYSRSWSSGANVQAIAEFAEPSVGTTANNAVMFLNGSTGANTQRGIWWSYNTGDLNFARFGTAKTAAPTTDFLLQTDGDAQFNYNVGIGRDPSAGVALDVNGTIRATDGTVILESYVTGGAGYFGTETNHPVLFLQDNAVRLRLNTASLLPEADAYLYLGDRTKQFNTVFATGFESIQSSAGFVGTRKLEIHMDGTGTAFFTTEFATSNTMDLLDTASGVIQRWDRNTSDVSFDAHIWPRGTTETRNLGLTTARWLAVNAKNLNLSGNVTSNLTPSGTRYLGVTGSEWNGLYSDSAVITSTIEPKVNGGATLGGTSKYWSALYTQNATVNNNGPALGAGQNIAPLWVTGTSGFVSFGLYRTDDTNGGWLFGTSALAVGDFAIYQNQGAGSPTRRLSIGTSGAVDVPGSLTATGLTINTGSATVGYVWTATSTGGAGSWQAASGALPVTDTTGIAKGSSDATKIVRFEVDGLTTATTRVLTVPDADMTLAGRNVAQTFSAAQTVSANLSVTSGSSLLMDRATRATNQQAYWTVAGNPSTTGAWSIGTVPNGAASEFRLSHNGSSVWTATEGGQVDFAGTVTVGGSFTATGTASAAAFNGTGSNPFRVAGTTVIDSSRNASIVGLTITGRITGDVLPNTDGGYVSGSTSFRWGSIATYNADFNGALTLQSGSTITGSVLPTTNNLYALGNTSFRWSNVATVNANISGTITAPSGSTGVSATKTVRDSAGTGTCTLIFSGGILTGGTC